MIIQMILAMSFSILQHCCCARSLPSNFCHFQPESVEYLSARVDDPWPPCRRSTSFRTTIRGCLHGTTTEFLGKSFVSCTVSLQLATNQLVASSAASVREARRFAVLHNICKSLALDCALHVDFRETKCQPKDSQRTTEFAMINQSINIIRMLKSPVLGVILYIQIRQKSVLSLRW